MIKQLLSLTLVSVLLTMAPASDVQAEDEAKSGVIGVVTIGNMRSRSDENKPKAAKVTFSVRQGGEEVATFTSSEENGAFQVALPPGDYVLVPDKDTPIPRPEEQTTYITVNPGTWTELVVTLDTRTNR